MNLADKVKKMSVTGMLNIHDPDISAESQYKLKIAFALTRLCAKEAFKKQGGDFGGLISYGLYDFSGKTIAGIHMETQPVLETGKIETKMFSKYCSYDKLPDLPFKVEVGSLHMIANNGSGKPLIVDLSKDYTATRSSFTYGQVHEEVALLEFQSQPVLLPTFADLFDVDCCRLPSRKSNPKLRKKSDLVREVTRKNATNGNSSSDDQTDSKTSKTSSDNDQSNRLTKKPTAKKSKHQGKAKTFKRKTQRRGRV